MCLRESCVIRFRIQNVFPVLHIFSVLHVHRLVIFQNNAHIQTFEMSPSECMPSEMSEFATQREEFVISDFRYP